MTNSKMPRKQRKANYDAPSHTRRKLMSSHLSPELRAKYDIRSLPVRKGDVVKIMRGDGARAGRDEKKVIKGKEGRVTDVFRRDLKIAVEGVNFKKADNKEVVRKIHPSSVMIIRLDLTDPKRREKVEAKIAKPEGAQ
ncbi:MAG: 50S ribosomal protein L24 [Methanobacteriota archaeon]